MPNSTTCDCLVDLLDQLCDALEQCELEQPECKYVSVGRPAVDDCPLLAVWLDTGQTFNERGPCKGPMIWRINIGYWSCWPTVDEQGNVPDCDVVTECACDHYCYVDALIYAICESIEVCGQLRRIDVTNQDPSGGCVGTIITATVTR